MNRQQKQALTQALSTVLMICIALALGAVLVVGTGNDPLEAYTAILKGAFKSPQKISELFVKVTPILIMAFGVSIAYRAQLWNIGAGGQFVMGAIAAAAVGIYLPLPAPVLMVVSFLAAVLAGALWAALAGFLKNRFNANEVITTSLLTYIADYFLLYLVNGPMQDPYSDLSQSDIIPEAMRLPKLFGNTYRLHMGLIVLLAVIILMIFFWRTSTGYRVNLIGQGEQVATYAGVNVKRTVIITMMISGGLAGLAGWIETLGITFRLLPGLASDYGNVSTIIALLGSLNVYGIMVAAAFFSVLLCGGAYMQRSTDVPYSVVNVIQGLIIILVIAKDRMGNSLMERFGRRKENKHV